MQKFFNRPSIQHVLLRMHKTGKYYPSAKWIASGNGRGMSIDRANAAWLLAICPDEVKMDHVVSVYFGRGADERYFSGDNLDVKTDELLAVHEGVLAGADPALYAVANQLDADIQQQLAAEHANGEDALWFDERVLALAASAEQDLVPTCNVNVNADV